MKKVLLFLISLTFILGISEAKAIGTPEFMSPSDNGNYTLGDTINIKVDPAMYVTPKCGGLYMDGANNYIYLKISSNNNLELFEYKGYSSTMEIISLNYKPNKVGKYIVEVMRDTPVFTSNNGKCTSKLLTVDSFKAQASISFTVKDKSTNTNTSTNSSSKAANPLKVSGKTYKIKYKKLKKKTQTVNASKVLNINNAKGSLSYKK